ncbi:MAG: phosphatidate cytidylyltransferase [Coriobacteriaceae bacterium]|nr:phosphatidate cytidylyltransferase [Coriobacteriaceae bacterium]
MSGNPPASGEPRPAGLRDMAVRVATALVLGTVVVVAVVWGRELGLGIVISVIAAFAVAEFYAIARREHRAPNEVFGVIATAAMPLAAALWGMPGLTSVVTALVVASLLWHLAFRQARTSDTAATVFGAVYVGFMLSHLVLMRRLDEGTLLVMATILSVWANDVFAYLIGSTMGRHRMVPAISPRKSWEGFAAGTAFTVAVWMVLYFVADTGLSLAWHAAAGVAVSVAAVVGDLAESRLKREAGVKDSGRLLPGHGGFLDRFDSLILVSVVAFYILIWAGAR